METNKVKIFDTTLRDGEQSPGCSMNLDEKLQIARQLEKLNVDVIEAGFAVASPGDFESVSEIAKIIKKCSVASLCRANKKDIDVAWNAVRHAKHSRIHTFLATSPIHMQYKLRMSPEKVYDLAVEMVAYAKSLCDDIEFSAEDASRSDWDFLVKVFEGVINAGATVINVPDTVGYTTPNEYFNLISYLKKNIKNIDKAEISVHCHNDLGMAVANSLAAIQAGATQIECTINGIGERAGNAALEEVVMNLKTRKDFYKFETGIETKQIANSSLLLTSITGVQVQPNKAIVGANAFAHESGIHQHGMLANKETYEIMCPEDVGISKNNLVLGKHSGKHAFINKLKELGIEVEETKMLSIFDKFKDLADKKKKIFDEDIVALVFEKTSEVLEYYASKSFSMNLNVDNDPTVTVTLLHDNKLLTEAASGDGTIDATYNAIEKIVGLETTLIDYKIRSISKGKDAQCEVNVVVKIKDKEVRGHGLSTDIIKASIRAYLQAINKYIFIETKS